MNTDFFNSGVSCVNEINSYVISNFINHPIRLPWYWSTAFQYATIVIEMIIPFGLFWHQTRKYAAGILLFFHFYLSFSVFADFSSLALFLIIGSIHNFDSKIVDVKLQKALQVYLIFAVISIVGKYFMSRFFIDKYQISFFQGVLFNMGFVYFVLIYFKKYRPIKYCFEKTHTFYLVPLVILISLWTLKAYVGLGNAGNLTMFSNLVTEKSNSNHFLINTRKTKIVDFEEDCVEIISIKNNPIANENFVGYRIPVVEFKYLVHNAIKNSNKPLPCTLKYKDRILSFDDLKKSEFNSSKWWYKYLSFRIIQINRPNECRW